MTRAITTVEMQAGVSAIGLQQSDPEERLLLVICMCDACPETSSASPWKQRGSTCTPLARAGRTHLNLITRQLYKTPKGALGREMNPVKHHLPFSPSPSRKQRLAGQPEAPAPHGHGHRTLDTHSLGALERSGSWSTKTQHLNSTARH